MTGSTAEPPIDDASTRHETGAPISPDARRVAVVTGASSGIGEVAVGHLADAGFLVYAAARRLDRLEQLSGPSIRPLPMDVTDDESITAGVQQVLAETGRVDALVNNAG